MRGEKFCKNASLYLFLGSSPRAWGKEPGFGHFDMASRIIPTCVGKRKVLIILMYSSADHPHVRGEKEF